MRSQQEIARLRKLARLHGIQTAYADVQGRRVVAPEATLRALLSSLGVPARDSGDCDESLLAATQRRRSRPIDDVVIAWDGLLSGIDIHNLGVVDVPLPHLHFVAEDGAITPVDVARCRVESLAGDPSEGRDSPKLRVYTGLRLPIGYHHLICTVNNVQTSSLVIAAPRRCYGGEHDGERMWGMFAPLYALRSETDCGAGSYSDLLSLSEYCGALGGGLVGTLPLLPCFYAAGGDPSPYLPVSRLLWSEFYIDPDHIPLNEGPAAHTIPGNPDLVASRAGLRQLSLVDYVAVQRLKRELVAAAYQQLADSTELQSAIDRFVSTHPHVPAYAAFRATHDRLQAPWRQWPLPARNGDLTEASFNGADRRLREFEQWLAHEQMARCVNGAASRGVGLYLDLPVGVHPDGYDTWRYRDSFIEHVVTGAPPDSVFTTGQRWGSPPLNPVSIREHHYDYVRAYLAHHMESARMLRVDHVMGLHHLFCIPDGSEPAAGAYLRYRHEEWYAILSLESHRHRTIVVGEDLGLVPQAVHRAMANHGLSRMFVLYYEMDSLAKGQVPSIPANCLASLNTHDMPPFAAMWQGLDISQQHRVGILKSCQAPAAKRTRARAICALLKLLENVCPHVGQAEGLDTVLRCILGWLGTSRARFVMVNIEDLWLETAQQNIPGIGDAHPSWRHRATMGMEDIRRGNRVRDGLEMLRDAMRAVKRRVGGE